MSGKKYGAGSFSRKENKMKKNYTLTTRSYDCVLINDNNNFVEYSVELDTETLEIKEKSEHFRLLMNEQDLTARWIENPTDYVSEQSIVAAKKAVVQEIKKLRASLKEIKDNSLRSVILEHRKNWLAWQFNNQRQRRIENV